MSPAFEAYLARIYTDRAERERFLSDPRSCAADFGLSPAECDALATIDRDGLVLAAGSFERKREISSKAKRERRSLVARVFGRSRSR